MQFPATFDQFANPLSPDANPFVDQMHQPYNLNYGLGMSVLKKPIIFGGDIKFPTGNRMRYIDF